MLTTHDARLRDACAKLHRAIWGRGIPTCASHDQRAATYQLQRAYQQYIYSKEEMTHQRIQRAQDVRADSTWQHE